MGLRIDEAALPVAALPRKCWPGRGSANQVPEASEVMNLVRIHPDKSLDDVPYEGSSRRSERMAQPPPRRWSRHAP